MDYPKFLLFGDSIIQFAYNSRVEGDEVEQFALGAALCNAYTRKMDIVQRGFSGYNSRWGLILLPKILEAEQNIALSTIFFGSNDACLAGNQQVPLDEYVSNTKKMISILKAKKVKPILIGPGLIDREKFEAPRADQVKQGCIRTNENFEAYSKALDEIAQEESVPFVNLNTAFRREGGDDWRDLLRDGLHLSGKGYEIFYNELLKSIREFYPELAPENIAMKLTPWREVKPDGSNIL